MLSLMAKLYKVVVLMFLSLIPKITTTSSNTSTNVSIIDGNGYQLSWRLAVETNNIRKWRTVPVQCIRYVENYMLWGQYARDLDVVIEQINNYVRDLAMVELIDDMDAWILDIDDTCISNLAYYKGKRYGGDPFDPAGFKAWAQRGVCPAISPVLRLFEELVEGGFKVILLTGREEEALGAATMENLHNQGFVGYERLIMRGPEFKGQSAVIFKSEMRRRLTEEGYRIQGNVGDQWSDLTGEYIGDRTFKLPNPMYFVP